MLKTTTIVALAIILLAPLSPALAYIGPGAGISVVGSLLSIFATFFVAIGAIIIWPLRKLMKRRKALRESPPGQETAQTGGEGTRDDVKRDDSQG